MKITVLMENDSGREGCLSEHGLSLYIETKKHKLLMDTGASSQFLKNAGMLGIDMAGVDTVILSHGHYDHGGGIPGFLECNQKAVIYMQRAAGGAFYHVEEEEVRYIGIDPDIPGDSRSVLLDGDYRIDEELFLFSHISGRKLWPEGNRVLKRRTEKGFVQDVFDHEQCLVIRQDGKHYLLSGCAHNGILNILERYRKIYHSYPDAVISGFHMKKKKGYTVEDIRNIEETARVLKETPTIYYTGHCTGEEPYRMMKKIMGEKIRAIHSGDILLQEMRGEMPDENSSM